MANRKRTTRLLLQSIAAAMALAAGIIGVGSVRTPTAPSQGEDLGAQLAPIQGIQIRVASFNIHSGRGRSGKTDLALTAKTLEGFDFVGLQEVWDSLAPGTPPQGAQLATPSQAWLFAPTERQYWGDRFGNGLVTSIPISSWKTIPLPAPREHSRRNAIIAKSGGVTFIITHITRSADQDEQLQFITKLFLDQPGQTILMGDLNATSEHPLIESLLRKPGVYSPLDQRQPENEGKHIDWIITRGLTTHSAGTRDLGASDHPLVWAELQLIPPPSFGSGPASSPSTQPADP